MSEPEKLSLAQRY